MQANTLLYLILGILSLSFILENYLDYLNLKHQKKSLDPELEGIYPEEEYQKSLAYQKVRTNFSFWTGGFSFILSFVLLATGLFGALHDSLGHFFSSPIWQGLAFFALLGLGSDILSLPFQLYSVFRIEAKFGFNRMDLKTFIFDKIKGYGLGALMGAPLGYLLFYFILNNPQSFWLYFGLIFVAFSLFMNIFYTSLILPWFNKLSPLPEGELREAIEDYCAEVNFPLRNLFVIDGSKRSNKSNAFFSGLGKQKKVVLYDTLIEKHEKEELVAVLAHEVGHYKKNHIPLNMFLSIAQTILVLYILGQFVNSPLISQAMGSETWSIALNLMAFGILFSPVSTLIGIAFNILSRKNEFEADRYARDTYSGPALESALRKLSAHNLGNLQPHPWYVFFHYSHPPLGQRLKALKE